MKVGEGVEGYAYETLDASYISEFKGFGAHDSSRSKGQCHEVKGQVQDQDHSFRGYDSSERRSVFQISISMFLTFSAWRKVDKAIEIGFASLWFVVLVISTILTSRSKKCVMFRNYYHNAEKNSDLNWNN